MNLFKHPIMKTALVVIGVMIVLKIAKPYTERIPVIGQYL